MKQWTPNRSKSYKVRKYSLEDINKAVAEVKSGKWSLRQASKKYNVPRTTISRRVSGKNTSNNIGAAPVLSQELEAELVGWMIRCQSIGDPQTSEQVRNAAAGLLRLRQTEESNSSVGHRAHRQLS